MPIINKLKQDLAEERWKAIKEGKELYYNELVPELMSKEEAIYSEILFICLDHFDLEEQDFIVSQ